RLGRDGGRRHPTGVQAGVPATAHGVARPSAGRRPLPGWDDGGRWQLRPTGLLRRQFLGGQERVLLLDELLPGLGGRLLLLSLPPDLLLLPRLGDGRLLLSLLGLELLGPQERLLLHDQQLLLLLHGLKDGGLLAVLLLAALDLAPTALHLTA